MVVASEKVYRNVSRGVVIDMFIHTSGSTIIINFRVLRVPSLEDHRSVVDLMYGSFSPSASAKMPVGRLPSARGEPASEINDVQPQLRLIVQRRSRRCWDRLK